MSEIVLQGETGDLNTVLSKLQPGGEVYVMLHRLPDTLVTDGQDCVLFGCFQADLDYENWQEGAVFCREYELRWRRSRSGYRLVYTGDSGIDLPGLRPSGIDSEQCDRLDQEYILWGTRLDNLHRLGIEKPPDLSVFFEVRIPRPLLYPVPGAWYRAALLVREMYSRKFGRLVHHRCLGLRSVPDPASQGD